MAAERKRRAMSKWSVSVTIAGPGTEGPLDNAVGAIADRLSDFSPAIAISLDSVTVRVAIEGRDAEDAVARGVKDIRAALEEVGWPTRVRDLQATEWSFFEEKLAEPTYPELVGITEIADLLGTSRQRASELAHSGKFPAPVAELAAGPVWFKTNVARFVDEWDRKPGRPRSKTTARLQELVAERKQGKGAHA